MIRIEAVDVTKIFGGVTAVDEVSIAVEPGEAVGLVGANGAGKSTVIGLLSGFIPVTRGEIRFAGTDVTSWPAWRRSRAGIVRTFQGNRTLPRQTVRDHFALARASGERVEALVAFCRTFGRRSGEGDLREIAQVFGLDRLLDVRSEALSFGQGRLLGIAMAMLNCEGRSGVVLLDEPFAGMNEVEIEAAVGMIRREKEKDLSIILVDHHIGAVRGLVDRLVILEKGSVLASGIPENVLAMPDVADAFLGSGTYEEC